MKPPLELDWTAILRRATQWFIRTREQNFDAQQASQLERWMQENPLHEEAFRRVSSSWEAVGRLRTAPELVGMRADALRNAARAAHRRRIPPRWTRRRAALALSGCAFLVMFLCLGAVNMHESILAHDELFETRLGERQSITLADHSVVLLDSASKLSVHYSSRTRALHLLAGQAEFRVAKDAARPFTVTASDRTVVATGTVFTMDLLASRLTVTLLEGHVVVERKQPWGLLNSSSEAMRELELQPAQQLTVRDDRSISVRSGVNLDEASAWTRGKLVFNSERLGRAIDLVNRYSQRRIVLADTSLANLAVSGVFNAGDSFAFLVAVSAHLPLHVRAEHGQDVLEASASAAEAAVSPRN